MPKVYAVDFDGYLCKEAFPDIGPPIMHRIEHFIKLRAAGNQLILWTCREEHLLWQAVVWCENYGLEFDAVNANLPDRIAQYGTDPRKVGADYYCDDKNYTEAHEAMDDIILKGSV